jgi:hypothetical protein
MTGMKLARAMKLDNNSSNWAIKDAHVPPKLDDKAWKTKRIFGAVELMEVYSSYCGKYTKLNLSFEL